MGSPKTAAAAVLLRRLALLLLASSLVSQGACQVLGDVFLYVSIPGLVVAWPHAARNSTVSMSCLVSRRACCRRQMATRRSTSTPLQTFQRTLGQRCQMKASMGCSL
jgi:hypothetical protein